MTDNTKRSMLIFCGLGSWGLILFAWLYLEKTLYLAPCPLCMMQRVAFGIAGFFILLEGLLWPIRPFPRGTLLLGKYLGIFLGIGLASRHLYIQSHPAEVAACGFDFWGLLDQDGFWQGILTAMKGTGDCATIDYFLGLPIPMWSLMAFIGLLFIAIVFGNSDYRAPSRKYR